MQVKELMSSRVVTTSPEEPVSFAARLLARNNIGVLPVCSEDGRLRGIVTDRDIVLRCVAADSDPETTPVKEIMTRNIYTVGPEDDVKEISRVMASEQVRRLPVVSAGKLVGMISLGDISKVRAFNMEASKALSEICSNIRRK